MMKTLLLGTVAALITIQAQNDIGAKIEAAIKRCADETKVDPSLIEKARNGEFGDDPALSEALFCYSKEIGFMSEEGQIWPNEFQEYLKGVMPYATDDVIAGIVDTCAQTADSPQQTALKIYNCIKLLEP